MKKILVAGLMAMGAIAAVADDAAPERKTPVKALKVLMIGNSFSVCNCIHMPAVAKDLGLKLDLASLYIGGCTLERHWNNFVSNQTDSAYAPYAFDYRVDGVTNANSGVAHGPKIGRQTIGIREALTLSDWDVITLQQGSHMSWQPCSYHPYGDNLVAEIRKLCPKAEIVLQETWSYTPWDKRLARWGMDQNVMYSLLHAAYADFAQKHGFRVIPMGTAVQAWRRELPVRYTENTFGGDVVGGRGIREPAWEQADGKWIPKRDVFHLSPTGEYLQALVWTAKLFGADVTGCAYRPDCVTEAEAALMKKGAMKVVAE